MSEHEDLPEFIPTKIDGLIGMPLDLIPGLLQPGEGPSSFQSSV